MIGKIKYAYDEIRKNYNDRYWWRMRLENRVVGTVQQQFYGNHGIEVMDEDWDNLIVLDACRADIFADVVGEDTFDDYRVVKSKASATPEWMERNFAGKAFGDTVYVSANPWVSKIAADSFHDIVNLWLDEYDILEEELADVEVLGELGLDFGATIHPDKVNRRTLETADEYDDKRLIVHYFQPHAPFVGNLDGTKKNPDEITGIHPGEPLARGMVSKEDVWNEYRENLAYVWHHARELASQLDGKTVITSDHGELFGEWLRPFPIRGYAHPIGLRSPEIVDVPWAVIDGDRRRIVDDSVRSIGVDQQEVSDRLRDLGYKE